MAKNEKDVKKQKNSSYFKEMKAELKKVVWPTPKELFDNTVAVIAFVLIIAIIVFVSDICFDSLNKYGITKLQEKIKTSIQSTENTENTENQEESKSEENTESSENNVEVEAHTSKETENKYDLIIKKTMDQKNII